jgi:hypothetical protein
MLSYDAGTGELTRPAGSAAHADEAALAGYLATARALMAAAPGSISRQPETGALSAEFEHLRWFELPAESLN